MNYRFRDAVKPLIPLLLFAFVVSRGVCKQGIRGSDPTAYVNPFIGTADHGHTFPGATVPFGMVQLSPDNGTDGWDWCSGYNYADTAIIGFSHTHLSGTGIGDLCDILFMPAILTLNSEADTTKLLDLHSVISHEEESAEPGYYSVLLKSFDIRVQLTATERAGFQKYIFPQSDNAVVVLNLGHAINWDRTTEGYLKIVNDSTIVGYRFSTGWAKDQRVYFAARFSRPFGSSLFYVDSSLVRSRKDVRGRYVIGAFKFRTNAGKTIYVKTGISSASIEGAMKDLDTEIPGWNFDKVRETAQKMWRKELSRIKVETPDSSLKATFYTALYHTMMAPNVFSDADGYFKGADGKVHRAVGYKQYTVFSLWDTFRAEHPLFTIVERDRVNDFIRSMLAHYEETGLLPVWELEGNETNTMIGYPAVPVVADAILKGFRGFKVDEAYTAMKKSAMQDKFGINYYKKYGYVPADKESESVSRTLEYAYDDWCIAQVARFLHRKADYEYFMKRSENYKNLFNPSTGFMQGRLSDGKWVEPFNPFAVTHEYTESNAWPYSFFVPQDAKGLIKLYGGDKKFDVKLDSLFSASSALAGRFQSDITGMVGQYAQGDEQSHQIAYLYDYAGEPWRTQEMVRKVASTLYTDSTNGLCGNDDCGQMSAWYVFSSIGFYSVNPASGVYAIGSPMFDKVRIDVGNGKDFVVMAKGVSNRNCYIQSAKLNGKSLNRPYITQKELMTGSTLVFQMGNKPNKNWGSSKSDSPPASSYSR